MPAVVGSVVGSVVCCRMRSIVDLVSVIRYVCSVQCASLVLVIAWLEAGNYKTFDLGPSWTNRLVSRS